MEMPDIDALLKSMLAKDHPVQPPGTNAKIREMFQDIDGGAFGFFASINGKDGTEWIIFNGGTRKAIEVLERWIVRAKERLEG